MPPEVSSPLLRPHRGVLGFDEDERETRAVHSPSFSLSVAVPAARGRLTGPDRARGTRRTAHSLAAEDPGGQRAPGPSAPRVPPENPGAGGREPRRAADPGGRGRLRHHAAAARPDGDR